ncbi:hypothetical protein OG402_33790 [Streptomyces anulatus]|uniref:hypothetical protein n=1 Tax=Streptomyces anulatus TaxID=1892 RepID=UPI00225527C9|nr:hypothetical protein [Streptomyces anulatus]MCX4605441.1 hypothetical protein [Streptomyces anulatus]
MIASLTWQPTDTNQPETVTVDMPAPWLDEFQMLRSRDHDFGEAVAWIPVRDTTGTCTPRLFRLGRILSITEGAR